MDKLYKYNGAIINIGGGSGGYSPIIEEVVKDVKFVSGSIDSRTGKTTSSTSNSCSDYIAINGANELDILVNLATSKLYTGIAFYDGDYNFISGYSCNYDTNLEEHSVVEETYIIPKGAIYFRTTIYNEFKESFYATLRTFNYYEMLSKGSSDIPSVSILGRKFLITSVIDKNYYLRVNDDYRVYSSVLVNKKGEVINNHLLSEYRHDGRQQWETRKEFGRMNLPNGYGEMLLICKEDFSNVNTTENVLKKYEEMSSTSIHRIPLDGDGIREAWLRAMQLQRVTWIPIYKTLARGDLRNSYFFPYQTAIAIPYSAAYEYDKLVGEDVSLRTFITSLYNHRSLFYTESLHPSVTKSGYGITYHKTNEMSLYYGMVCSGFVSYALGLPIPRHSSEFRTHVSGVTSITDWTLDDLRPMDIVLKSGHIYLITDIFKDDFGNVKYIVISESIDPMGLCVPYSVEAFLARIEIDEATLHRYSKFGENKFVPDWSKYVMAEDDDCEQNNINPLDICTFAGDYASFVEGDKLYLNVLNVNDYNGIELYKDDVLINQISLSNFDTSEGFVDVDMSPYNLSYGKYKARLVGNFVSDFTHFEIVKIELSASATTTSITATYNVVGGNAIGFRLQRANGTPAKYEESLVDNNSDTKVINWANASDLYLKLFVQGEYGKVTKRVLL